MPKTKRPRNSELGMQVIERALAAEKGLLLRFHTRDQAVHLRHQIYIARKFEAEALLQQFEVTDARRYASRYEGVRTKLEYRDDQWLLYVEHGLPERIDGLIVEEEL